MAAFLKRAKCDNAAHGTAKLRQGVAKTNPSTELLRY
jgi:hypothetical protein